MTTDKIEELLPRLINTETRDTAFTELVKATQKTLYWHIRRIVTIHEDADDVLQNTYIKAWKSIEKFKGESQLYTWLYRIATNEALTHLASERMRSAMVPLEFEELMISRMEADVYYEGDEMAKKLKRAILSLPEKQRMVFNMRYYDEMPYAEISKITGTSEGALKASYHIAVEKIQKFVKEEDDVL